MLPEEFKAWRKKLKLTQIAAGDLLGVSRITIQNWESGDTAIPLVVGMACEMHERRFKMRPEYGPVTLTYFDAPLWQPTYGPITIPRVTRERYPDNDSALRRLCDLRRTLDVHNPLIVDESGDVVWPSPRLEEECSKRMLSDKAKSKSSRAQGGRNAA